MLNQPFTFAKEEGRTLLYPSPSLDTEELPLLVAKLGLGNQVRKPLRRLTKASRSQGYFATNQRFV